MNREVHVRFCERRGVRLPPATHPIYADFERGDFSRADWADPQVEYVVMDGPSPGAFTGLTEIATGVREILSPWKDLHDVIDEYRELGDERVLVLLRADLRGKTSGLGLDASWTRGAEVVHIKQGRVTRIVKYFDRDRALADLGLEGYTMPEESTTPDLEKTARRIAEALNRRDFDAALS